MIYEDNPFYVAMAERIGRDWTKVIMAGAETDDELIRRLQAANAAWLTILHKHDGDIANAWFHAPNSLLYENYSPIDALNVGVIDPVVKAAWAYVEGDG